MLTRATRRAKLLGLVVLQLRHASAAPEVRLFTPSQQLSRASSLTLSDGQRHYLGNVMRFRVGDVVNVFNGEDGEWSAEVAVLSKRECSLIIRDQTRTQPQPQPAPTLVFGMLKSQRLPMLVEKACELGVGNLQPVVTEYCAVRKLNVEKLSKVVVEAAEQCRRLTVPTIEKPELLLSALETWDPSRPLFLCDERGDAPPLAQLAASEGDAAIAGAGLLIGPEGGFSPAEFEALDRLEYVQSVSLGAHTLRAETAALAACAVLACR